MRAVLLLTFVALTGGLWSQELRLATTEQLAPFVPVVEQVVQRAGLTVRTDRLPQVRLYAALRARQVDGAYFLAEIGQTEVPGLLFVPVVLFRNEYVAVSTKPGIVVRNVDDLKRYTVAVERGNSAQEAIVKDHPQAFRTPDQKTEFLMLAAGRVDLALASRAAVPSLLAEAGIATASIQEPALFSQPLYLGLIGDGLTALDPLTAAFRRAVDDGSWARNVADALAKLGGPRRGPPAGPR